MGLQIKIKKINLYRNFSKVGAWTLVSRVAGFSRDILMAAYLGAGPVAEAFLVAFALPNMFRRFFAEGAFNTAFVPMFSNLLSNKKKATSFASNAFTNLFLILSLVSGFALIFMPGLIMLMASGFNSDVRFNLAIGYGRITFIYIILISLSALCSGVLNSLGKFSLVAALPIILNICLITAILSSEIFNYEIGLLISIAVPIAGVIQLSLIYYVTRQSGIKIYLKKPKFDSKIKKLLKISIPACLAAGVIQINLLVGKQIASFFDGAIAWLNYADRLYQLPLGVVGIAIGVVLLPTLSKTLGTKNNFEAKRLINESVEFAMVLGLPATVALIIIPGPLISVLFERGAFTSQDSLNTASALMVYGFGLPAFILQKVLLPIFFSKGNTTTPFNYALVSMLANLILALGLIQPFGFLAPAIGTTVSSWIMTILLLRKVSKDGFEINISIIKCLKSISLSIILMSIFLIWSVNYIEYQLLTGSKKYLVLALTIMTASIIYFSVLWTTRFFSQQKL